MGAEREDDMVWSQHELPSVAILRCRLPGLHLRNDPVARLNLRPA